MINLKEHIKLTGVYTFFAAFPAILQLIVYPIIEGKDRLGAEDFGYLAIAEAIVSFITVFCLFGMGITIARLFFDYNENKKQYNQLVSTIFSGIIFRTIIFLPILYLLSDYLGSFFQTANLQDFNSYGYYLLIIAFNRSVIGVALSLYRNEKKFRNFIIVSLLSGFARSTFQIIGVLYFDMSFKGYLMGTAIGGSAASLFIIIYTFYSCRFSFSKSIHTEIRKYATPLFFTDLLLWGTLFIDRFLLLPKPDQLGIYDNAIKFAAGVYLISQGLANAVQPELFRFFKTGFKENESNIKSLSNLFITENIIVIGVVAIPLMAFINFFYETELILSASIIPLILLRNIINAQYQIFLWPILYLKKTKLFFIINTFVLFTIVIFNILLTPRYGFYGAIFSFLFAGIFQVLLFYVLQQKSVQIKWNITKVLLFPFTIIILTLVLEFLKILFKLNVFLISSITTFYIFAGLIILYRKEIHNKLKKSFCFFNSI